MSSSLQVWQLAECKNCCMRVFQQSILWGRIKRKFFC